MSGMKYGKKYKDIEYYFEIKIEYDNWLDVL